ncbi:MAG: hypothetical protein ACP5NE_01605 [Candidatus Micrarchaeia archaeon]
MKGRTKLVFAAVIIVAIIFIALIAYVSLLVSNAKAYHAPAPVVLGPKNLSAYVQSQDLLFYNNNNTIIPYAMVTYTSRNITKLYLFGSLYKYKPPSKIYLMNTTDECLNCGNIHQFYANLSEYLADYGLLNSSSNLQNVSAQELPSIANDSVLIIPNGLLPSFLFSNYGNTGSSLLQYLVLKGVSIIYIGGSFSNMLLPGGVVTPSPALPPYLSTTNYKPEKTPKGILPNFSLYFSSPTFSLANGYSLLNLTYVNIGGTNSSVVAFSNYLDSWKNNSEAAEDVAKTIASLIWMPYYSNGYRQISLNATSHGSVGVIMDFPNINYNYQEISALNSGYGRIFFYTNESLSPNPKDLFSYSYYLPDFYLNGTLSLPKELVPNGATNAGVTLFTKSVAPIPIELHITIYDTNMSEVYSLGLPPVSAFGNFTFVKHVQFPLAPGEYIASLQNFYDQQYAASLFFVPNITIKPIVENFSSGKFIFFISDLNEPISGVNYSISINKLYPQSGIVQNGTIQYILPPGSPQAFGNVTFDVKMFSESFPYVSYNPPHVITINSQYVELAIVLIIVFLMVVLIRAPNRDEFYIDVPILPPQQKVPIKIKSQEILSAFDKLNAYYHWKFMPLSMKEIKSAISNYIRYNNIPVNLTYSNIELLLNKLASANLLVQVEDLYMPSYWVSQSGHSAEYLAIFKKLRNYFVKNTFVFSDLDSSNLADIVTTMHGDRVYFVIYADTSKFRNIKVYPDIKLYIAFLNADKLSEFKSKLYASASVEAEELKMYISAGVVKLVDADNPSEYLS